MQLLCIHRFAAHRRISIIYSEWHTYFLLHRMHIRSRNLICIIGYSRYKNSKYIVNIDINSNINLDMQQFLPCGLAIDILSIKLQASHQPRKCPKGWAGEAKRRLLVPWWRFAPHPRGGEMICSWTLEKRMFNLSTMDFYGKMEVGPLNHGFFFRKIEVTWFEWNVAEYSTKHQTWWLHQHK